MSRKKRTMSRRSFIQSGALGALAIPVFANDLDGVFGQTSVGKPPLTIAALNAFFQNLGSAKEDGIERLILAARRDLPTFLSDRFTINPKQMEVFRNSYASQRAQYDDFLRRAIEDYKEKRRLTPPVAEFDLNVSEFVRISGFGMTLNACRNEKISALTKQIPKSSLPPQCVKPDCPKIDCAKTDCKFIFQCNKLCQ